MKSKISKIMGIGLTFVLLASLMVFALPASASPGENEWSAFDYPAAGADGKWFYDPDITAVGPIAEAINGDLYAYVGHGVDSNLLMKSTDGGRTWAESLAPGKYSGGAVVDMVCSDLFEDVLYVTDGTNVYWSQDAGDTFAAIASANLATEIESGSIESLDVGYIDAKPYVFISTNDTGGGTPTVFFIAQMAFPSAWTDLYLDSYLGGDFIITAYSVNCAPDFEDSHKIFAVVTGLDLKLNIDGVDITLIANDDAATIASKIAAALSGDVGDTANAAAVGADLTFTAITAGAAANGALAMADAAYSGGTVPPVTLAGGVDAVAQVDTLTPTVADITVYALTIDGTPYTYTSDATATAAEIVAGLAADMAADPTVDTSGTDTLILTAKVAGIGGGFITVDTGAGVLTIVLTTAAADAVAATGDITITDPVTDGSTQIVTNTGTSRAWSQFGANLKAGNTTDFGAEGSSDICFPDDYADTNTLFVGVVDETTSVGGDVYLVTASSALDLNIDIITEITDIISLDIKAGAALIAGADGATTVYYSTDGGWNWAASAKDPTGGTVTYVLWYGDSALAATTDTDCAVSLSCGEEVGKFWNQISLIATDIEKVLDIDHSPGYITKSGTLFMLTDYTTDGTQSLFRYDQANWERVFCSTTTAYGDIDMVLVSPDFDTTNAVFVADSGGGIWGSTDVGCSWTGLRFSPSAAEIYSAVVIDEDTVIAGGEGVVYKTTEHGAFPWDEYAVTGAGNIMSFAVDGDTILFGDNSGNVFLSEDVGVTWAQVGLANIGGTGDTSVVFDPGYAVTGDPGENTIYASAGEVIARFVVGTSTTAWTEIYSCTSSDFWGMATVGDTALYVSDRAAEDGTLGGMVRCLNPTAPAGPFEFERVATGLAGGEELSGLLVTTGSNVLWALDSAVKTNVWTYEDLLATPVLLESPTDGAKIGTTGEATLTWEALDGATKYEINFYRYCPQCPDEMLPISAENSADTCAIVTDGETGLTPGTTYYWQVRVALGSPFLSKWSELRSFDTALGSVPGLCSPICGSQDIILTPNFSWDLVTGATGYEVQIATNEDFDPVIASGTPKVNAWAAAPELDYSTTYYWQVRAVKDGVVGAWAVCLFTTMDEPAEPIAPITPVDVITEEIVPLWIWVIIGIGAALTIAVIVLIVNTRRVP